MRKTASQIADYVLHKVALQAAGTGTAGAGGGSMQAGIPGATPTMALSAVTPQPMPGGISGPAAGARAPSMPMTTAPKAKPPSMIKMKPPAPPKPFSGAAPMSVGTKPVKPPQAGGKMPKPVKTAQENEAAMTKLAPPKVDPTKKLVDSYPLKTKTKSGGDLIVTPRFPFGLSITGTF